MKGFIVLIILILKFAPLLAQRDVPVKDKIFNFSISPSLGTNGLHPGSFNNYITLNLTSGYSASSLFFELGIISNLNTDRTIGLQIAGLANITGGNSFARLTKKERIEKINTGFDPYLSGLQFSGLTNIVLGNAYGLQVTGGVNLNKGAFTGVQLSGISNVVYKFSFGVQLSGLFNVSQYSMSGVQIAMLSNYTKGEMGGVQIAAINQAGNIYGVHSFDRSQPTGFQIGLINFAQKMDGYQIGLINFAKRSQGTQIGLINFYKGGKQAETKDGTAIGLVNIGDFTYLNVYTNELYAFNYEISTGNRKNGRILRANKNVYVTNSLVFSHNSYKNNHSSFGYGIKKMFFNRSELPGQTESKFLGYGLDVQYVKLKNESVTRSLNLLSRAKLMAGKRIAPKLDGFNWFVEISFNVFGSSEETSIKPETLSFTRRGGNLRLEYWPGFSLGFLIH